MTIYTKKIREKHLELLELYALAMPKYPKSLTKEDKEIIAKYTEVLILMEALT